MKRIPALAVLVLLPFYSVFAQQTTSKLQNQVKSLDRQLYESAVREDAAIFSRLTSDDYTNTGSGGEIRTKRQIMAAFDPSRKRCTNKPVNLDWTGVSIRLYGNIAIVTGLATETSDLFDNDCKPVGSKMTTMNRYINIFVNQRGVWRAVATQFTSAAAF